VKTFGPMIVGLHKNWQRVRAKIFSLLIGRGFAEFGAGSILENPVKLRNPHRIAIGSQTFIGPGSWFEVGTKPGDGSVAITIGSRCSIAGSCVMTAAREIVLEDEVLFARNVYVSDHRHRYDQVGTAVLAQGIDDVRPVRIRRGAWLGTNVVVCPGVTIGEGAVIGANAVVTRDIPDFSVAAGAPARVIKSIEPMEVSAAASHAESGGAS
jgi:acetyltransferase-like isoleucine patch superfamily enzyme